MSCLCLTHGRPERNACHLSGWKNDSKSSNSKSLAALLDLPSLANMDWCWEAGGACYKSVNNTQECVHTNFHDAWKEQAPSPRHLRWHANTSEMIINVLITSLWQEVSFSCVDHPRCQFCFLSSAVLYAYYESRWAEYTDRKRKKSCHCEITSLCLKMLTSSLFLGWLQYFERWTWATKLLNHN